MTERNDTSAEHPSSLVDGNADSQLVCRTNLGALYQGDCIPWLRSLPDQSIEMVFAASPRRIGSECNV